ncbi:MAG: hypothetical protein JXR34_05420 [Bacteroidales bacterium]|nr:hypothetical protein [Bacteroidales bacterium]
MNKLSSLFVLLVISLLTVGVLTSSTTKKKKSWKGIITYSISYDGEGITPASIANAPKSTRVKVMGDKSATEMLIGPVTITEVQNPEFDLHLQLIEYMDKKYVVKKKLSEEKDTTEFPYEVTIDLVNETKMICTYPCNKAVVTLTPKDSSGTEHVFNCYYSTELGDETTNKDDDIYSQVPGMLLEFSMVQGPVIMSYLATEVKKGSVSDADFLVPTDFKVVTEEELQKEFGG